MDVFGDSFDVFDTFDMFDVFDVPYEWMYLVIRLDVFDMFECV